MTVVGIDVDRQVLRVKIGMTDADIEEVPFQNAQFIRHQPSRQPDRRPRPGRKRFDPGEEVRIVSGAFAGFEAVVDRVDEKRERVRVTVRAAGRPMQQELAFSEVEKR